ncbi:hypothetical protein BJ508DRAFT_412654 [Ascobolus immersus RN42]|uniref:Uncharacterized protein n=1 Tax=Ascobolus immersus RN42 TaxID=1160509 RepID=A0A3N4IGM2_ASCIM|nr:hypothetical protein BJ508DRAFT_412654 [Ascobolus immersus RN42]
MRPDEEYLPPVVAAFFSISETATTHISITEKESMESSAAKITCSNSESASIAIDPYQHSETTTQDWLEEVSMSLGSSHHTQPSRTQSEEHDWLEDVRDHLENRNITEVSHIGNDTPSAPGWNHHGSVPEEEADSEEEKSLNRLSLLIQRLQKQQAEEEALNNLAILVQRRQLQEALAAQQALERQMQQHELQQMLQANDFANRVRQRANENGLSYITDERIERTYEYRYVSSSTSNYADYI